MDKKLLYNSLYSVICRMISVIFPLLSMAYASRVLLPDGIGKIATAENFVAYFILLASLGIPTYGVKVIANCHNSASLRSEHFSELIVFKFCSSILLSILYYAIISLIFTSSEAILYKIFGLLIIFNALEIDWFFKGLEKFKYILVRNLLTKAISFIALVIFVKTKEDLYLYAVILVFSELFTYIVNLLGLSKYIKSLTLPSISGVSSHIKSIFILFASSIAIQIYILADITMLSYFSSEESVGYYSTATKAIMVVRSLLVAFCAVFLPRLSYLYFSSNLKDFKKLSQKTISFILFVTIPVVFDLVILSPNLINIIFGSKYSASADTIIILTPSIISVALTNFIGYQILIAIGKEKLMFLSTFLGCIVNVILNLLLIPSFDFYGAAISSVFTEILVLLVQIHYTKDIIPLSTYFNKIHTVIIGSFSIATLSYFIRINCQNDLLTLVTSFVGGVVLYFIVTTITGNPFSKAIYFVAMQKIRRIK